MYKRKGGEKNVSYGTHEIGNRWLDKNSLSQIFYKRMSHIFINEEHNSFSGNLGVKFKSLRITMIEGEAGEHIFDD